MDVGTIGGEAMNAFVWIGLLVGAALFIYLLAFLIYPERFL
ncbi:K(+)-transporting ATPase subunit F [Acidithiobacillus sulfuriphilus]